jgi:hypothetical protein
MRIAYCAAIAAVGLGACGVEVSEAVSPLTGGVSVSAGDVTCNGATDVAVSITGTSTSSVNPTDVVLIIDESGSIGAQNFTLVKQFAIELVNGVDVFEHGGKVGVVFFSTSVRTIIPLSTSRSAVVTAITNANYGQGNTCTGCGIDRATDLFQAGSDASHHRIAVVVTDGVANVAAPGYVPPPGTPNTAMAIANAYVVDRLAEGATEHISYVAIGVGAQIDLNQLRVIGTGDGDSNVYTTPNFGTLDATLFTQVITSPEATGAMLSLVINNLFVPGAPTATRGLATQVGQNIGWSIPAIQDQTATLSFSVTHAGNADGTFPLLASYSYSDAEGNALSLPDVSITVTGCDADDDGVPDNEDQCLGTDPGDVVDENGCSVDQLCPCNNNWRNHGEYVVCVAHTSTDFVRAGLLTHEQRADLVSAAAQSDCGK